jgi:GTPase SAR1 family protein
VLVFDLTRKESFLNVEKWIKQVQLYASQGIPIVLVGNKLDLTDTRQVSPSDVDQLLAEKGLVYFETSAKVDQGVNETFRRMTELILTRELDQTKSVLTKS